MGDCQGLPGFQSFHPGHVCTGDPGDCVPLATPSPEPAACSGAGGSWAAQTDEVNDPGGHREFIPDPIGNHQVSTEIETEIISMSLTGTAASFVAVQGAIQRSPSGSCDFVAGGVGRVAGIDGIEVVMVGSFFDKFGMLRGDTMSGSYAMGTAGGLPGGEAITFFFSGQR
ncbi:MAG: hypothetical protein ABGY42_03530 [bacterium]